MARSTAARAGWPGKREANQQCPACARQTLRKSRTRAINQLQQFAAAERPSQINFLPSKEAAKIKRAGIEEIARRPRLQERFHAIARA
jgi:hypothetical protein